TLLSKIDTVWGVIRSAHDQIKCRFRAGVLHDKAKEIFIFNAPLVTLGRGQHLIAAENFVKALFATEFSDSLPAQISAVEKSCSITELLEDRRGRGRQSTSNDRLKVHERSSKR